MGNMKDKTNIDDAVGALTLGQTLLQFMPTSVVTGTLYTTPWAGSSKVTELQHRLREAPVDEKAAAELVGGNPELLEQSLVVMALGSVLEVDPRRLLDTLTSNLRARPGMSKQELYKEALRHLGEGITASKQLSGLARELLKELESGKDDV